MLEIPRIPDNYVRTDWQVIEAVDRFGRKGAAYHLRITLRRVDQILARARRNTDYSTE
jgi:hypothetical protein